jgi:hypothetical protein
MFDWFKRKRGPEATYLSLRAMALDASANELGSSRETYPRAFGIVVELGFPTGAATLVVMGEGSTSLYFSGGGGVIGGGEHESVRRTSARLLSQAQAYADEAVSEAESPLPCKGEVRFVFLTYDGRRVSRAEEAQLETGRHKLSPLFIGAHEVIAEMRELSPE